MSTPRDRRPLAPINPLALVTAAGGRPRALAAALPADRHPASVYLASLGSPHSRRNMEANLHRLASLLTGGRCDAETLDWAQVRYQHAQALRTALAEHYAPATVNHHLAALRGVLRECWRLGLMDAETYQRAADVKDVRGTRLPAGRHVPASELFALFGSCAQEGTATATRDAALLAVLYGAGLRRGEATGLDRSDYDADTGELTIRHGKGRKERLVYATNGGRTALARWLAVRGDEPGALFCGLTRGQRVTGRRLTPQAVRVALRRRAAKAGVPPFSPHDLRRTCVGDLLDAGADLVTVQHLAGHASPVTTARYDRRGERAKRHAAEMLHVPYAG